MEICNSCGLPKEEEEFNWRFKALGMRAKTCRECKKDQQHTWYMDHQEQEKERVRRRRVKAREDAREYIYQYKLTNPCENCGETDPVILDFHHVRGKGANIPALVADGTSLKRIKAEINLCIILCSNCRRKLTASERRK